MYEICVYYQEDIFSFIIFFVNSKANPLEFIKKTWYVFIVTDMS